MQSPATTVSTAGLEAQIAAPSTETASLKQQLQHHGHYRASPNQGNVAGPPPDRRPVTAVAYATLNVGGAGANDVATLKLDARPSGSTSSDPVASIRRATGGRNTTGLTGKCPTTTIRMSGHEVAALLDTTAAKLPRSQRHGQQPICRTAHCSKSF